MGPTLWQPFRSGGRRPLSYPTQHVSLLSGPSLLRDEGGMAISLHPAETFPRRVNTDRSGLTRTVPLDMLTMHGLQRNRYPPRALSKRIEGTHPLFSPR